MAGSDNPIKAGAKAAIRGLASATAGALGVLIQRPWSAEAARPVLARRGFHLLPRSYDAPIPEASECDDDYFSRRSELVGVDMNEAHALDLLDGVLPPLMDEFRRLIPLHRDDDRPGFFLINGNYMAVDAHVYYAFIRHFRPRRIVEIGSGNSTLLAATAVVANRRASVDTELIAIEPYPGPILHSGFDGLDRLIEAKVQDVPLELFQELGAGDILFIDSSHVVRSGGDVEHEYLEILPRLAPGVLVHVHDVALPRPYPRVYFDRQLYWTEQHLLQAFLAFNSRYEVIWPGAYLMDRYPDRVLEVFPECVIMQQHYPDAGPSAFWMRVRS